MSPRPPAAPRGQSGFVLIGVIIFVLALTIIGLSLYSLSSYEAGFLERSIAGEQAFQSALGGIELVKFKLAATSQLGSVAGAVGVQNVTAAVAIQEKTSGPDSTGAVVWQPDQPMLIRVTARVPVGGDLVERRLQAQFTPIQERNLYSYVISTPGRVTIVPTAGADPNPSTWTDRRFTVDLPGPCRVWETAQPVDTTWKSILGAGRPACILTSSTVPGPAVDAYIAAHPLAAMQRMPPWPEAIGTPYTVPLDGSTAPVYYRESTDPGDDGYSLYYRPPYYPTPVTLQVRGRVVLVFQNGVRFDAQVNVQRVGNPNEACLVIVAGPSTDPAQQQTGIFFFGGLVSEIPVVLVSSGNVEIAHLNNPQNPSSAPDISIFASNVTLIGPESAAPGSPQMTLAHDPTGGLDTRHIPYLAPLGALPNVTTYSDRRLRFVAGSWRDSLP